MNEKSVLPSDQQVVSYQQEILGDYNIHLERDIFLLDLGCGSGRHVYEHVDNGFYNTYGFDIKNYVDLRDPEDEWRFRFGTGGTKSRIPFEDDTFDMIFSMSTFEHVLEQELLYREIYRIMKPGGVFLNNFPSKWRPIEPHIFVPFGGVTKSYFYFLVWAFLGIRNSFQKNKTAVDTAKSNHQYAQTGLKYLACKEIDDLLERVFDRHRHVEASFIKNSRGRSHKIYGLVSLFPFLLHLYRFAHNHIILMEKAPLHKF